jgi:hypothetical protein
MWTKALPAIFGRTGLIVRKAGRPSLFVPATGFVAALLLAALAPAQQMSPPAAVFGTVLGELKEKTGIPILLPAHLPPVLGRSLYASAEATAASYTIRLESEPDCNQSEVCYVGMLSAKKGAAFSFPEAVQVDKVIQGRFQPVTCAGTCSPPAIEWKLNGVLYSAQLNLKARNAKDQRAAMMQLAESAVRAGAR